MLIFRLLRPPAYLGTCNIIYIYIFNDSGWLVKPSIKSIHVFSIGRVTLILVLINSNFQTHSYIGRGYVYIIFS